MRATPLAVLPSESQESPIESRPRCDHRHGALCGRDGVQCRNLDGYKPRLTASSLAGITTRCVILITASISCNCNYQPARRLCPPFFLFSASHTSRTLLEGKIKLLVFLTKGDSFCEKVCTITLSLESSTLVLLRIPSPRPPPSVLRWITSWTAVTGGVIW